MGGASRLTAKALVLIGRGLVEGGDLIVQLFSSQHKMEVFKSAVTKLLEILSEAYMTPYYHAVEATVLA